MIFLYWQKFLIAFLIFLNDISNKHISMLISNESTLEKQRVNLFLVHRGAWLQFLPMVVHQMVKIHAQCFLFWGSEFSRESTSSLGTYNDGQTMTLLQFIVSPGVSSNVKMVNHVERGFIKGATFFSFIQEQKRIC